MSNLFYFTIRSFYAGPSFRTIDINSDFNYIDSAQKVVGMPSLYILDVLHMILDIMCNMMSIVQYI